MAATLLYPIAARQLAVLWDKVLSYNPKNGEFTPSTIITVATYHVNDTYISNGKPKADAAELLHVNETWTRASNAKIGQMLYEPLHDKSVKVASPHRYYIDF